MTFGQQTSVDPELEALQEEWSPDWKIWRARRGDDRPGELPTGSFLATLDHDEWGVDRTIMQPTAKDLDAALRLQVRR